MTIFKRNIFLIKIFLFIVTGLVPANSETIKIDINTALEYQSKKTFTKLNNIRSTNINSNYKSDNLHSNLSISKGNNNFNLDDSFINYKAGNLTFGIGKINRNWSYSKNTSIILSSNSRPSTSIYFKINEKNNSKFPTLALIGPWSLEIFNARVNSKNLQRSMLLGTRATINPVENLHIEFFKTSQWGGNKYDKSLSSLKAAFLGNTNEGSFSDINQMAGVGFSYNISDSKFPLRFYTQVAGEDEAGGLPSCLMYMAGLEWNNTISHQKFSFNLEFIDTRINKSRNGFCGPNTAYNNSIYEYSNYGVVMGAPIDTESKEILLAASTKLSSNLQFKYSLRNLLLNDANWKNHRLSSLRQHGLINSIDMSWSKGILNLSSGIEYQDMTLDNADINNGLSYNLKVALNF